jgi:hypothetical protein
VWRFGATADIPALTRRIADLEESLRAPRTEIVGDVQASADGAWGVC